MPEYCINCEHFEIKGSCTDKYRWGLCMKPEEDNGASNGRPNGVFRWGHTFCNDFKAKKEVSRT